MALTNVNALEVPYRVVGNRREVVYDCTFDNKYATGGESLTPADVGLNFIERATCSLGARTGSLNASGGATYNKETQKLLLYAATAEVASEADASGITIRVVAQGA